MSDEKFTDKKSVESSNASESYANSVKETSYAPPKTVFPMNTEYNNYEIKSEDYNNHPNGSTILNKGGGRRRRRTRRHKSRRTRKSRKGRKSRRSR